MSEWKTYMLGNDVVTKLGDGLHGTPIYDDNGEYYFINGSNLVDGNIVINSNTKKVTEEEFKKYKKDLSDKTILLGINGTIGNVALYNNELCILGKSAAYLNINDNFDKQFIRYVLTNNHFQNYIKNNASGTTIKNVGLGLLREYQFSAPKDKEQQKEIAQILTALDDKIELNLQMNQTLEAMAQALIKEWFVNFNFPNFDGELENGLPKGWRMGKLGEVVSFVKGVSYRSAELVPSKFALVTLKSFNRFGGLNYRGFKEFFGKYKETQVLNEGDVIIAQTDITQAADVIGCPAIVENPLKYEKLIASIDIVKCVPINTHFSEAVLFYFLYDKRFKDYCLSHTNGSTVLHLRSSALPNFEFPIPDNELLKQFTEIINPIREKIISNNKQIQTLTQTRDTLLPKLMSGKLELV